MTSRRVPPTVTDYLVGPAETMLKRLAPPVRRLLEGCQQAIEDDVPEYMRTVANTASFGAHVWLAGGVLRAVVLGETPRDVDLFFNGSRAADAALAWIKQNFDHQALTSPNDPTKGRTIVTKLNVVLEGHAPGDLSKLEITEAPNAFVGVDLVRRYSITPLDTARRMDFVCCSAALSTKQYARHLQFESDTKARVLSVNAPWAPRATWNRMERFLKRGWVITEEQRERLQELAGDARLPEWDFVNDGNRPEGEGWEYA